MARPGPKEESCARLDSAKNRSLPSEGVRGRGGTGRTVPAARDLAGKPVSVEGEVRGHGGKRGQAAAGVGRGEPATEAPGGGPDARQTGIAGGGHKKVVGPQMRRQAVVVMRSEVAVSERRACGLMG